MLALAHIHLEATCITSSATCTRYQRVHMRAGRATSKLARADEAGMALELHLHLGGEPKRHVLGDFGDIAT